MPRIMRNKDLQIVIKKVFTAPLTLTGARLVPNSFTRVRKMSFVLCLYFFLDMNKSSLQSRLDSFFSKEERGKSMWQQSFSKLREKFDHSPFEKTLRAIVKEAYSDKYALKTFNDYILLGVDGSYFQLPRVDKLLKEFGVCGNGDCPTAGVSVLYDIKNGMPLDAILTKAGMNEREECVNHINFLCKEYPEIAAKCILMLDSGYPSAAMFRTLNEAGIKFVVRCSSRFLSEINNAALGDSIVTVNGEKLRIVKFVLPSGEIEILATNLFDLLMEDIIYLYQQRWGIEVMFYKIKNELGTEKFSGKSVNSIRQDFWASMVVFASTVIFQNEANEAVNERQQKTLAENQKKKN